ncbi:peptidase inhibitor family I36 protein [Streptomyces nigra]|uniref:peptidase inhibitor family I36 protein n=1 Tax=Streptomyces nigra TaxID=1827580 RepID=UPI0034567223
MVKKKKFAAAVAVPLLALAAGAIIFTQTETVESSAKVSAAAKAGPNGGPICVFNDVDLDGEFFNGDLESPRDFNSKHCFGLNEEIGHLGTLRNNVDDAVSSIANNSGRTVCFWQGPDFTGGAIEVRPYTSVNLTGRMAKFNDTLTSMRACPGPEVGDGIVAYINFDEPHQKDLHITGEVRSLIDVKGNLNDQISRISNFGRKPMCGYVDGNFGGNPVLDIQPGATIIFNGHYAQFNDRLSSIRPC